MNREQREQHCKMSGHVWSWKKSELGYSVTRTCANCGRQEKSNPITGWTLLQSMGEELAQKMTDAFFSEINSKD